MSSIYIHLGCLFGFFFAAATAWSVESHTRWQAGFSRIDVTPVEPVRTTGYSDRDRPSEGVDTPLNVRAMALRHGDEAIHVLVTVDSIGISGVQTQRLASDIETAHGIKRNRLVISSTHTHAAPDLVTGLDNIFMTPLSDDESAARQRYSEQLDAAILRAVDEAIDDLAPAGLSHGQGAIGFAVNRRVIQDGRWVQFGVQADGPVDQSVSTIRVSDADGKIRGVLFNYACHCTTLPGNYFRINADWAGYAATQLEKSHPDCVAMCTIGCGADANPEPRGKPDMAAMHGLALAGEVNRVIKEDMRPIDEPIEANFGFAGLSFDSPTTDELAARAANDGIQYQRNAKHLQETLKEHGRLPATYPVPIQSWRFGDDLTMIFLGGEVVVDYALRLKKELDDPSLWVSAYCNDVLGYIASERMRGEGGYEFDRSAVFYNLPGPWATGSEDLLIHRVHEILESAVKPSPLTPDDALNSIRVPDGFAVQLVASEPLVRDPINIAFGLDGRLWVVEMGDYPGTNDNAVPRGKIKFLSDTDGDGVFDAATTFLDGIEFATAVHPWKDGLIVCAAPDIFFARDTDGDGVADERTTWYTGFPLANPQHRVNGFTYGLEHALHCASGDNLGDLKAVRTGETVNASGRDVRIWPTTGKIDLISGRTQYIRSRNDWGECFGNDNSRPMYHYPIEDRYLRRNPAAAISSSQQQLFNPPSAPPVFPISKTADRFNDLFAANRFTSACSSVVFRSNGLGESLAGAALVCEPVHNLTHRSKLVSDRSSYRAERDASELQSEFIASTDPWFRPVRAIEGTDGMLWVVDMYRQVIEHPEWIPESWQKQVDLRAGAEQGRIYRVVPKGTSPKIELPNIAATPAITVAAMLDSDSGAVRDLVQQHLLCHPEADAKATQWLLESYLTRGKTPQTRLHALWCLAERDELTPMLLKIALADRHFGVVRSAILLSESRLDEHPDLLTALAKLADHDDARVKLQLALTLGETSDSEAGVILAELVDDATTDEWLARALITSATPHVDVLLQKSLARIRDGSSDATSTETIRLISQLIQTASQHGSGEAIHRVTESLDAATEESEWAIPLATALMDRRNKSSSDGKWSETLVRVYRQAAETVASDNASDTRRCQAIGLLGRGLADDDLDSQTMVDLISPRVPLAVQLAAVARLGQIGHAAGGEALIATWPTMSQSVRAATIQQMLTNGEWTTKLLAAMERGEISSQELSPAAKQTLQTIGSPSSKALARRLLGDVGATDRQAIVVDYLSKLNDDDADVTRGAEAFKRMCAACHVADDQGRMAGPNLVNLTDRSPRALVEAILDPNRAVDPQYRSYTVLLEDGRVLSGVVAEEAGESLTLVHADGKRTTISRRDIDQMRSTGLSLMPQGFESELPPPLMSDVLKYVREAMVR
ncbi:Neutral/alkaline non-lysosomal ceramidase [Rubripirellula tenax]|uniref:Neutral/alkaline non-lysosomal ceramidase n=1 Tax=Rubripirellula tenax TaxID=2528015 RepID=A0A5C6FK88_9BACT|nr:neutral/alkaline non-lysosomal ceramidase N-terminal domain-containing protein [Rubripirellula tenax]TWU60184.1 Neutral/alkaline non-lysosomal ceramidase [Rubripirellula tenax]